jgi:Helix-turn-helix domain
MTISTSPIITTVSMPDGNDAALLTLSEAAAILRVPVNTLRWWRQQGTGPGHHRRRPSALDRGAEAGSDSAHPGVN